MTRPSPPNLLLSSWCSLLLMGSAALLAESATHIQVEVQTRPALFEPEPDQFTPGIQQLKTYSWYPTRPASLFVALASGVTGAALGWDMLGQLSALNQGSNSSRATSERGSDSPASLLSHPRPVRWFEELVNSGLGLVYGVQGSRKSAIVRKVVEQRLKSGYRVEIAHPGAKAGEYRGLKVYGAGEDYLEIDQALENFLDQFQKRALEFATNPNPTFESYTLVCEEVTRYPGNVSRWPEFLKIATSDIRKKHMSVLLVAHGDTMQLLGMPPGFSETLKASALKVELFANPDRTPKLKGKLHVYRQQPLDITLTAETQLQEDFDYTPLIKRRVA
ncbi:hypothetical protein [Leptolyngbya sp. FACHB-261]|uniref:hypothetical protein n=1 Tax=Leptolyngbya sp. FACHB-261 TaxID=2692806 RepID=UPI0016834DE4|nr:hypothetical protein [Leptolyngbya sp. FACHB-261]MBD2105185.1 hypothetical protein [Leptolyngbya sp. FACHB-261]